MVCTSDHLLKSIVQLVEVKANLLIRSKETKMLLKLKLLIKISWFPQDASYGYVKFSNEKTMTKEQLDELWRTNEKLQVGNFNF